MRLRIFNKENKKEFLKNFLSEDFIKIILSSHDLDVTGSQSELVDKYFDVLWEDVKEIILDDLKED